jgi:protein-L-isoaspartate(D-aspartate) O-methyltransferase
MKDLAEARTAMVESQVRTADVTSPAILAAMRSLPRELFLPADKRVAAYADLEPEVAPGRYLLRPRDLGKLLQNLGLRPTDRALEVAGATGYGAAVLAGCVRAVVTVDPSAELSFAARAALDRAGAGSVVSASTDIAAGWPEGAPYDVILLNGSAEFVPSLWLEQLAEGGRLGLIVRNGAMGEARIYTKAGGTTAYRVAFDAAPPFAPCLQLPKTFAF